MFMVLRELVANVCLRMVRNGSLLQIDAFAPVTDDTWCHSKQQEHAGVYGLLRWKTLSTKRPSKL